MCFKSFRILEITTLRTYSIQRSLYLECDEKKQSLEEESRVFPLQELNSNLHVPAPPLTKFVLCHVAFLDLDFLTCKMGRIIPHRVARKLNCHSVREKAF